MKSKLRAAMALSLLHHRWRAEWHFVLSCPLGPMLSSSE
jgi:hypothetical protein